MLRIDGAGRVEIPVLFLGLLGLFFAAVFAALPWPAAALGALKLGLYLRMPSFIATRFFCCERICATWGLK